MALLTFPSGLRPQTATYELLRADAGDPGPWGTQQIVERPLTAKWRQVLGFTGLKGEQKRLLVGFANAIRYRGNTVRLPIFGYERAGPGGGTPLVKGAAQAKSRQIVTDGWPINTTVLRYGDFIELDGYLHSLTADAATNGLGEVTLQLEPERKTIPADNAPIEYLIPTALFRHIGGAMPVPSRIEGRQTVVDAVIDLIEV